MAKRRNTAQAGVHERAQTVTVGEVPEGGVIGKIVILNIAHQQRVPWETLRQIYQNAGLQESHLPRKRAASDAFRLATASLRNKILDSAEHGTVRVLVRDWKGGRTPRKDLTLEAQDIWNDRFVYTSPAMCIFFDPETQKIHWDNRLNSPGESVMHNLLECEMDDLEEEFQQLRDFISGETIYNSLLDLVSRTNPLPLGLATYLVYKEHDQVVQAIKSVVTALNEYQLDHEEYQSSVNIFTVCNIEEDRNSLSNTLDKTIAREVDKALEQMALIMREPEAILQCQATVQLDNYNRLKAMADEYSLRVRKDRAHIDARLQMLWDEHEQLMLAVAKNPDRRTKAYKQAQQVEKQNLERLVSVTAER